MSKMSKTAALRVAQSACGRIIRRSSSDYVCYVPYYNSKPDGPSTDLQASTYPKLVMHRASKVASIALALMGVTQSDEDNNTADWGMEKARNAGISSARDLVDAALKELQR